MAELNNKTNVFKLSLYNLPSSNANYILPVDNTFPTAILVVDAQMIERTSTGFKCKIESIDQTFSHGCWDNLNSMSIKPWIGNRIPYKIIDNKQINGKLSELYFEFDAEAFLTYGNVKISGIQRSSIGLTDYPGFKKLDIMSTNFDFDKSFSVLYKKAENNATFSVSFKILVSPKMMKNNEIFRNVFASTSSTTTGTNARNSVILQYGPPNLATIVDAFKALSIGDYANCIEEVWVEAHTMYTQSSIISVNGVWFSIEDTSPKELYSKAVAYTNYMTIDSNPNSTLEYIINVDGQEYSFNKYLLRKKLGNNFTMSLTAFPATSSSGSRIILTATSKDSGVNITLASINREAYSLNGYTNHKESWWQSNKNQWEAGMVLGAIEALVPALGSLFTAGSASGLAMGAINILGKSTIRAAMDDDLDNIPMGGGGDGGTAVNSSIVFYESYISTNDANPSGKYNLFNILYNPSSSFYIIPDSDPVGLDNLIFTLYNGIYGYKYGYIQGAFKLKLSSPNSVIIPKGGQLQMSPAEKKIVLNMLSEGVRMGYR